MKRLSGSVLLEFSALAALLAVLLGIVLYASKGLREGEKLYESVKDERRMLIEKDR